MHSDNDREMRILNDLVDRKVWVLSLSILPQVSPNRVVIEWKFTTLFKRVHAMLNGWKFSAFLEMAHGLKPPTQPPRNNVLIFNKDLSLFDVSKKLHVIWAMTHCAKAGTNPAAFKELLYVIR